MNIHKNKYSPNIALLDDELEKVLLLGHPRVVLQSRAVSY